MGRWIKAGIAVLLLAVLFWSVDWRATLTVLLGASPVFILLAVLANATGLVVSARKWQQLLVAHKLRLAFGPALRAYWLGSFASNFLPSSVGGDAVRIASVRQLGGMAEIVASVVVERLSGFVVLIALCALALAMRGHLYAGTGLLPVLWLGVAGGAVALGLLMLFPGIALHLLDNTPLARLKLVQRVQGKVERFVSAYDHYRNQHRALAVTMGWSVMFYLATVCTQFSVLHATGAGIELADVLFIAPLLPLIGALPISLNGIGLMEGAFVLFYGAAGVAPEIALAAALLRRLIQVLVSAMGAGLWLHAPGKVKAPDDTAA